MEVARKVESICVDGDERKLCVGAANGDDDVWKLCIGGMDGSEEYSPYKVVMMTIPRSGAVAKGEKCGDGTSCRIMPGSAFQDLRHRREYHVLIDTTYYSLYTHPYQPSDGCKFVCYQLDGNGDGDGESGWKTLPAPHNRLSPQVLVWEKKLYVLGGRGDFKCGSFGEVFDPKKGSWDEWHFMEDGRTDDSKLYVIPLGRYGGKLLFYDPDSIGAGVYDFQTQRQESITYRKKFFACRRFFRDALVVEKNNRSLLYWLDRDGSVETYDVLDGTFFTGRLTGLEVEEIEWPHKRLYSFTHLEGDMFSIVWVDDSCIGSTTFHSTIVEVKINHHSQELTAEALSCFKGSVSGQFSIDACFTLKV